MVKSNFYLITLFCKHNEVVIKLSSTSGLLRESLNVVCTRGFVKYKNIVMVVFTFCHSKKPIKWPFKKVFDGSPQLYTCLYTNAFTNTHSELNTNTQILFHEITTLITRINK